VRKNLQDSVPKAVMHFLVYAARRDMQNELVVSLYKEDELPEMMAEDEAAAARRRECAAMVATLQRGVGILQELRDLRLD
jgi:dynamin 1-like protein